MDNMELRGMLLSGIPDTRIARVANKITVVTNNGTEIVIKDRGLEGLGEFELIGSDKFKDDDELLEKVEGKNITITPQFYFSERIRNILAEI